MNDELGDEMIVAYIESLQEKIKILEAERDELKVKVASAGKTRLAFLAYMTMLRS